MDNSTQGLEGGIKKKEKKNTNVRRVLQRQPKYYE